MGCAIASAAMLGQVSYEDVAARASDWGWRDPARTRWPWEMHMLLQFVTQEYWKLSEVDVPTVRVREFASHPWPVAAWIQDLPEGGQFAQWIVIDDVIVHDPSDYSAWERGFYPLRDWFVGKVLEPCQPEILLKMLGREQTEPVSPQWGPSAIECESQEPQFSGYFISELEMRGWVCPGCGMRAEPRSVCDRCSVG
jgi:hypothetical protein